MLCSLYFFMKCSVLAYCFLACLRMSRTCRNNSGSFCHICGEVILPSMMNNTTPFVKKSYLAYFWVKLGEQDKRFAPHVCRKSCVNSPRRWTKRKKRILPFGVPMVWRVSKDHVTNCYVWMTNRSVEVSCKSSHCLDKFMFGCSGTGA